MFFIWKKKMIAMLFVSMLCIFTFSFAAYAHEISVETPRASKYIRSTSVNIIPKRDGKLLLENKLGATRIVDKLGMVTNRDVPKLSAYVSSPFQDVDE